jgi:hypothetical protein
MENAVQKIDPKPQEIVTLTPMQLMQMAVEKGVDAAQLNALLDLQQRWEADRARKAFVVSMAEFKRSPPKIKKNRHVGYTSRRTNETTDYDHATLDEVCNTLDPALSAVGITYDWETKSDGQIITVTCILTHEMGHEKRTTLQAGPDTSGNKNPIQAVGSTVTYLERYTLLAACGLATEGQDDDGGGGVDGEDRDLPISDKEAHELETALDEMGRDIKKFCKCIPAESLSAIKRGQLGKARNLINQARTAGRQP